MAHCRTTERYREAARGPGETRVQKEGHGKASVRAKVEHPFRVIKRQFGFVFVPCSHCVARSGAAGRAWIEADGIRLRSPRESCVGCDDNLKARSVARQKRPGLWALCTDLLECALAAVPPRHAHGSARQQLGGADDPGHPPATSCFAPRPTRCALSAADPRHLGAEIGFIAILHTWGQNLLHT